MGAKYSHVGTISPLAHTCFGKWVFFLKNVFFVDVYLKLPNLLRSALQFHALAVEHTLELLAATQHHPSLTQ